jgi:hypothetical protein
LYFQAESRLTGQIRPLKTDPLNIIRRIVYPVVLYVAGIVFIQNTPLQFRPELGMNRMSYVFVLTCPRLPAGHGNKNSGFTLNYFYINNSQ